jgi:hypothetical protein
MNKILFESNTFWLLRDYPEEPRLNDKGNQWYQETGGYLAPSVWYERNLKACIAAKTKIDNPELLRAYEYKGQWYIITCDVYKTSPDTDIHLKDGSIFDVPDGVEFERELVNECRDVHGDCQLTGDEYRRGCQHRCKKEYEVIHLRVKEVKTELKLASEMGIGYAPIIENEESQDELFHEVVSILLKHSNNPYSILKSKFKIQRIHPEQ